MTGARRIAILTHQMRDVTLVTIGEQALLDTDQVEQLSQALDELIDDRACKRLIVDFAKVRFLSSSALGALIKAHKKSVEIKGQLVLCGLAPEVRRVLSVCRLDKLLRICKTERDALQFFGVTTG